MRYHQKDGSLIRGSEFAPDVLDTGRKIGGNWLLVPDIRYERHRPSQTYEEINTLCANNDIDFYSVLKSAWCFGNSCKIGILLRGFPIPKNVGQLPDEIHWQPIFSQLTMR